MSGGLKVENLNFKKTLKDISFTLENGTVTALMGKGSSGKTTLLKCLFGLVDYEGIVNVNGTLITKDNIEVESKNLGIYLGIDNLENKNAFLNIIEPLENLNYFTTKAKKKVYEISRKLGIDSLLYKNFNSLSHSEKKVISFAQSIIHEPKVILIDNLFDSLDIYYKNKIVTYLNQIKKSRKSIIIFTTNNSEDLLLVDNLILIRNGKIIDSGSVKNLIQDENLFLKNDIKLPFLIDLSHKLKAYDLIDELLYDYDKLVDEIWK